MIVACLVVAGVVVIGLLVGHSNKHGSSAGAPPRIADVSELLPQGHSEDNPGQLPHLYDGNPSTTWSTAEYHDPSFSGLYPGLGLVVQLDGARSLQSLTVAGSSAGWSAQVYVASSRPSGGVRAWGAPVASLSNASSTATFGLHGRTGGWVLLWLTQLSSTPLPDGQYRTSIGELTVR